MAFLKRISFRKINERSETPRSSQEIGTLKEKTNEKLLSIVIPVLNEEEAIRELLKRIRESTLSVQAYEVVLSDSGSTDQTREVVTHFAEAHQEVNIKFVRTPQRGVAIARNNGAENSSGEYILFLDADAGFDKDFLEKAIKEMVERDLDIAGCYYIADSDKLIDKVFIDFIANELVMRILQYTEKPMAVGTGIIVRRELYGKVGGFSTGWFFAEDAAFLSQGVKAGLKFGLIESTKTRFSMRRFDEEGRLIMYPKCIVGTFCYLLDVTEMPFEYKWAHYKPRSKSSKS